jgi:hypothetical protein
MTRSRENADGARLDAPLASPVLVTPNLGTPSAGVMTNMTGAVTASLVDNAVTLAKMASGTDGNIISYDASGNPVAIATGSDGQVLTSTGAGSPPAFENAASGGGGKIGQVVTTHLAAEITFTSTSYADLSGATATITPVATSSRVWVQGHLLWGMPTNNSARFRLYRDSTIIADNTFSSSALDTFYASGMNQAYYNLNTVPISFIDSPSTTSATTYKINMKVDGSTLYINRIGYDNSMAGTSVLTLIEILA